MTQVWIGVVIIFFISSENKEENPLLLQRQSHFSSKNKEDLIMDMSVWYLMGAALVFLCNVDLLWLRLVLPDQRMLVILR